MKHLTALTLLVGDKAHFLANRWDQSPQKFNTPANLETIASLLTPNQIYSALSNNPQVCSSIELVREDRTVGGGNEYPGQFITDSNPPTNAPHSNPPTCDFNNLDAELLSQTKSLLLLPHATQYFDALSDLACGLQGELGHVVGVNVYLSPPSSSGFLLHKDGHDLLVVQTYGTKTWKLCEPKNPFDTFSVEGKHFGEGWEPDANKYNCYEETLLPGDVLYLPRGTLHQPTTTKNIGSLHLSIGIDVRGFRWIDLVVAHLRETVLLHKLSNAALADAATATATATATNTQPQEKKTIDMLTTAFSHPVSGEWKWYTLISAFAGILPTLSTELGMLTRSAFPMHLLEQWGTNETSMYGSEGKGKYIRMIDLMVKACPAMMHSVVFQFHSTLGDPPGSIVATKEAQIVADRCGAVIREAFSPTVFRFLAQNMMFGAQRLWERSCVLKTSGMMPSETANDEL